VGKVFLKEKPESFIALSRRLKSLVLKTSLTSNLFEVFLLLGLVTSISVDLQQHS